MPVNLLRDLIRAVSQINSRVGIRGTHFCFGTLKGREKFGVDKGCWEREGQRQSDVERGKVSREKIKLRG